MFKKILALFIFTITIMQVSAEVISITDKKEIDDWGGSCVGHVVHRVGERNELFWSFQGQDEALGTSYKNSDLENVKFRSQNLKVHTGSNILTVEINATASYSFVKKGNGWSEDITKTQMLVSQTYTCEFHDAVKGDGKNKIPMKIAHYRKSGNAGHAFTYFEDKSDCEQYTNNRFPMIYCQYRSFPGIHLQFFKKNESVPRYRVHK